MCVRGILPRIGFLELLCEMVTERWRLSLNMCETGRRCVRACERKRRSNLNVKERLWVITKWIAVQTKMSMVWDCGPVPIYHRMLERLHQLCEVFFQPHKLPQDSDGGWSSPKKPTDFIDFFLHTWCHEISWLGLWLILTSSCHQVRVIQL